MVIESNYHREIAMHSQMKISEFVSLAFSFVALSLSGITAYYQFGYVRESFQAVFTHNPEFGFLVNKNKRAYEAQGSLAVTFINSGTLPAAVQQIQLNVTYLHAKDDPSGCAEDDNWIEYELAPFVVRPGDIRIVKGLTVRQRPDHQQIPLAPDGEKLPVYYALVCMVLEVSTPKTPSLYVPIELFKLAVEEHPEDRDYPLTVEVENLTKMGSLIDIVGD